MPIVNGTWVNYSMPCLNANFTNVTNHSLSGIACIVSTDTTNIPILWIVILILWYVSMFFFMANDPQKSKVVAIALSGMIFATILGGYGLIGAGIWAASFAVFLITLFLYLLLGER